MRRSLIGIARTLGVITTTMAVVLATTVPGVAGAPTQATPVAHAATKSTVPPVNSRPFATLPHLGPAPQRCFQYGSSHNICTGPSWPYPPNANYLDATYYGTVYVSPHVVDEGQVITAVAAIDNKGHPSWPTGTAPDYGEPGPRVAGCVGDDRSCSWKAVSPSSYPPDAGAPGGGWSDYTMGFCGFFGCASSQDFYFVLPHKSAISGMVLDPYGSPLANAVVKISGPSNGTAVTGRNGFYDALVDPGNYTVSASIDINGQDVHAEPTECSGGNLSGARNSCSVSTGGDDAAEVDFALTCSGAPPRGQQSGKEPALAGPNGAAVLGGIGDFFGLGHTCPLFIKVTQGDTSQTSPFDMKSGVSLIDGDVNKVGFKKDANFQDGATFKGQCVSGCVDLLAAVSGGPVETNASGQIVSTGNGLGDVDLTATVVGISNDDEIVNPKAGNGDVCAASSFGSEAASILPCATSIKTKTSSAGDTLGQARLRYWGPASWQKFSFLGRPATPPEAHVKFEAEAHFCWDTCHLQKTTSPVWVTVAIGPHAIYHTNQVLNNVEFNALTQWAQASGISSGIQALSSELSKLKVFNDLRLLKALKSTSSGLKLTGQLSDVVILRLFEVKFGLVDTGLVSKNLNFNQVESEMLGLIKNPAAKYLANLIAKQVFGPDNEFDDQLKSMLQDYGDSQKPGSLATRGAAKVKHLLTLKVYESSFCKGDDCLPGEVPTALAAGSGIHYNLYFAFSSTDAATPGTGTFFSSFNVDTGYVAPTWVPAQCGSLAGCADPKSP